MAYQLADFFTRQVGTLLEFNYLVVVDTMFAWLNATLLIVAPLE